MDKEQKYTEAISEIEKLPLAEVGRNAAAFSRELEDGRRQMHEILKPDDIAEISTKATEGAPIEEQKAALTVALRQFMKGNKSSEMHHDEIVNSILEIIADRFPECTLPDIANILLELDDDMRRIEGEGAELNRTIQEDVLETYIVEAATRVLRTMPRGTKLDHETLCKLLEAKWNPTFGAD